VPHLAKSTGRHVRVLCKEKDVEGFLRVFHSANGPGLREKMLEVAHAVIRRSLQPASNMVP